MLCINDVQNERTNERTNEASRFATRLEVKEKESVFVFYLCCNFCIRARRKFFWKLLLLYHIYV